VISKLQIDFGMLRVLIRIGFASTIDSNLKLGIIAFTLKLIVQLTFNEHIPKHKSIYLKLTFN